MRIQVTVTPNRPSAEYAALCAARGIISQQEQEAYEWCSMEATLTTDHSASSYGQPVLVIDGVAYGPADRIYPLLSAVVVVPNPVPEWRKPEVEDVIAAAISAGYQIERERW